MNKTARHPSGRGVVRLLAGAALVVALALGLALAIHRMPSVGPAVANTLRALLGERAVARLEELSAAIEDAVMRARHGRLPPRPLSELSPTPSPSSAQPPSRTEPPRSTVAPSTVPPSGAVAPETPPSELPASLTAIQPPFPEVAAEGDGTWLAVEDPAEPGAPPLLYETMLHPDPLRPFAELFIVAMEVRSIRLEVVAGTVEPSTSNPDAESLPYRGLIPPSDQEGLLAAFNGGFRAVHGRHGMLAQGVVFLPARPEMCTIAGYADGVVRVATHKRLSALVQQPVWYRQTPPCMLEEGRLHPGLENPEARTWGATLEGETVIRRSALALSEDGEVLYVAVTNYTTARALALGLQAARAWAVAQLDVNWSYPKFLLFPRSESGARQASTLFKGFLFDRDEMLRKASPRDFFYVVRRTAAEPPPAPDAGAPLGAAPALDATPLAAHP